MIEANGTEIEESSDGISRRKPLSSPKSTRPRKNRAEPRSAKSRSVQKKAGQRAGRVQPGSCRGQWPLGQKGNQKSDQKRQQHRQQKAHEQKDTERGGEDAQAGGPKGS